jgi:hypothetical protein
VERSPERNGEANNFSPENRPASRERSMSPRGSPRHDRGDASPRNGSPRFDRDEGRDNRSMSGERNDYRRDRSPRAFDREDRGDRFGSPRREPVDENFTQLYVAGISRSVRSDSLRRYFEEVGEVTDIVLKSKYAFINFRSHEDAAAAIKRFDGSQFEGLKLIVQQSSK